MKLWYLAPLIMLLGFAPLSAGLGHESWGAPSFANILGTDEFGRDAALVLLIAIGRSLAAGALLAIVSISASTFVAYIVAVFRIRIASLVLKVLVQIVESIPMFVWVLAAFAALQGASQLIVAITFTLALLPAVSTIIAGEFNRLYREPFIDAALLLRASSARLMFRHILPNSLPILLPLFGQVLGTAMAIRGAIGLLGVSARTDYDLGIIMLRGKENSISHPLLMLSVIAAIALTYVYLDWLRKRVLRGKKSNFGFIQSDAMLR
jgi:peptide/nickel transport system permease protein